MAVASSISPLGLLHGALKPRVETHPDYVFSYGLEAGELMARAGRPLDAWQQDSIDLMLAVRPDGQWACFEFCEWVPRQNGKGGILEARALAGFFLLGEQLIMWSAHEYKTAMEAFRRVRALVRALGRQVGNNENLYEFDKVDGNGEPATFLVKINNTNGEEGFERLDTEARIKFVARSKGSGRGFSGDLNIIDEAFALTVEQLDALLYTLSARPNPQIVYMSSPPLKGDTGEIMYALRDRGDPTLLRTADDEPWRQDDSLGYRDWGLGGDLSFLDGIDLDDLANWAATNPALGIRITRETITRERRINHANPAGFARERLGIWPKQIDNSSPKWELFSESGWLARFDVDAEMGDPLTLAVDVTPDRTWAAIAAAGRRLAGGRVVDVIDHKPGTSWVVDRLVELAMAHGPLAIVCSDKALADAAEGAELPDGRKLKVIRAGAADMAAAAASLYDGIAGTNPDVWHLGQSMLTSAAAGATTRPIGDGWAFNRRSLTVDICPIVAVSLALWALGTVRLHQPSLQPFALT